MTDPQITPIAVNMCITDEKEFQTKMESILTKNHIAARYGNNLSISLTYTEATGDDGTLMLSGI